jgi:peptidoglycan-associated lipoprotein
MVSRSWSAVVVSLLVLSVALAGCAKRPATTQASAPAPSSASSVPAVGGEPAAVTSDTATGGARGATAAAPTGGGAAAGAAGAGAAGGAAGASPTTRIATQEFSAVPELKDIYFEFDKYDVRPEDTKILDANAAWLKTNSNMLVLVEGHCDERGTNEYNLALGERRAKAAMNYLVAQGVQASRITIISYGEERPVCAEKTDACYAKNRRAHFLVKSR